MARWEPDTPARLQRAALELFGERGYDATTVAGIAARAGLSERTFFRHFTDKREVLFEGAGALREVMIAAVDAAPASSAPIEAVAAALDVAASLFEERRDGARLRRTVIAANGELQERELIKLAAMASALAGALRRRGTAEPAATLTAEAGMAVFRVAFERWVDADDGPALADVMRETLSTLQTATAPRVSAGPAPV